MAQELLVGLVGWLVEYIAVAAIEVYYIGGFAGKKSWDCIAKK